jgi:hypothetical protein
MKIRTVFGLLLVMFLLIGTCQDVFTQTYVIGDVVDNFTLLDMDGNSVSLFDYEGYAIYLNFFTWG